MTKYLIFINSRTSGKCNVSGSAEDIACDIASLKLDSKKMDAWPNDAEPLPVEIFNTHDLIGDMSVENNTTAHFDNDVFDYHPAGSP